MALRSGEPCTNCVISLDERRPAHRSTVGGPRTTACRRTTLPAPPCAGTTPHRHPIARTRRCVMGAEHRDLPRERSPRGGRSHQRPGTVPASARPLRWDPTGARVTRSGTVVPVGVLKRLHSHDRGIPWWNGPAVRALLARPPVVSAGHPGSERSVRLPGATRLHPCPRPSP
jgi:hypothetical protein